MFKRWSELTPDEKLVEKHNRKGQPEVMVSSPVKHESKVLGKVFAGRAFGANKIKRMLRQKKAGSHAVK